MKNSAEIERIQGLAHIAATLLNTQNHEAIDTASPILSLIKAEFAQEVSCPEAGIVQLDWDGNGLPPVGAACQCTFDDTCDDPAPLEKWMKGDDLLCVAHVEMSGKQVALFWNMRLQNSCTLREDCYKPFRPVQESACNSEGSDPNPHYDPVAAATERLRLAMVAQNQALVERDAHGQTTESLEDKVREMSRARLQAQGELIRAIEATSRA